MEDHPVQKTRRGLDRIVRAYGIGIDGLRAAWLEKAFRQAVAPSLVMVPAAFALGRTRVETMMMLMSVGLVLICKIANSAVEAVVDRIGPEFHKLSGPRSAIVFVAILLCLLACGGVVIGRLRG